MSDDKFPKTNGLGSDPMQRLASFKLPRDLSLGGVKPNKKVFTPNLNVSRNKNKGLPTKSSQNQKKEDRKNWQDRKNDRNKNFKIGSKIIKSSGVFSEGLGSAERHTTRISYGRESEPKETVQKPTIRVKDFIKIDKELEDQKIKSVFGDSNVGDGGDCEDFKNRLERDAPIKLPMGDGGWSKLSSTVKVKQEVVVKREPDDIDCAVDIERKPMPDVKELFENTDVANLLKSDKPTLIFLQLPDTLPGRGGKLQDEGPRRKVSANEPSTSTDEAKVEKPVEDRCRLTDLEEGQIGKLLIHRSGRVSLAIGDTVFEVCMGTKASFQQEVVSVAADDASRSASLVALGSLQHKLSIVPHWETMFRDFV